MYRPSEVVPVCTEFCRQLGKIATRCRNFLSIINENKGIGKEKNKNVAFLYGTRQKFGKIHGEKMEVHDRDELRCLFR